MKLCPNSFGFSSSDNDRLMTEGRKDRVGGEEGGKAE